MHNKNVYRVLFAALTVLIVVAGCKKDLGNYNYTDINDVSFSNIDTLNGYRINLGDTLRISPELSGALDASMSGSYKYEWKLRFSRPYNVDSVVSTSSDLSMPVVMVPGTYPFSFSVTDNKTGVSWLKQFSVTVTTPYYEGWMVLNSVSDTTRIDFLSYKDGAFTFTKDVLSKVHSALPTQHAPSQLVYVNSTNAVLKPLNGTILVSGSGTNLLQPETFGYSGKSNIVTTILGDAPDDFKAEKMLLVKADAGAFYDNMMMYADGNIYQQAFGLFTYSAVNIHPATGARFKVSPHVAISGAMSNFTVMYNEEEKRFVYMVKAGNFSNSAVMFFDPSLNFPTGKDLLYMTDNNVPVSQGTNYAYAVLKDPGVSKFYIMRFSFTNSRIMPVDYMQEIAATDFDKAEHYAFSPDLGYLFYSVGGKLYEYDLFLKTSKLMLDKGTEQISMIGFDAGRTRATWKNWLMVGSYDPAGSEGMNGSFAQYSVPPVNGNLVQQNKWSGFGKIIDFTYSYR